MILAQAKVLDQTCTAASEGAFMLVCILIYKGMVLHMKKDNAATEHLCGERIDPCPTARAILL